MKNQLDYPILIVDRKGKESGNANAVPVKDNQLKSVSITNTQDDTTTVLADMNAREAQEFAYRLILVLESQNKMIERLSNEAGRAIRILEDVVP